MPLGGPNFVLSTENPLISKCFKYYVGVINATPTTPLTLPISPKALKGKTPYEPSKPRDEDLVFVPCDDNQEFKIHNSKLPLLYLLVLSALDLQNRHQFFSLIMPAETCLAANPLEILDGQKAAVDVIPGDGRFRGF